MTTEEKKTISLEEAKEWITNFKKYCEAQKIELSHNNSLFIQLERAYWLGIMDARKNDNLPQDIHRILYGFKSPLLDYLGTGAKRIRRTKEQIAADEASKAKPETAVAQQAA